MQARTVVITNKLGLHARAAAKLVRLAASFDCEITLARVASSQPAADAKSIFNVLLLAAAPGTALDLRARGVDEEMALGALCSLIEEKFGEE